MVLDVTAAFIRGFQLGVKLAENVLQRLTTDVSEDVQTTSATRQRTSHNQWSILKNRGGYTLEKAPSNVQQRHEDRGDEQSGLLGEGVSPPKLTRDLGEGRRGAS